MATGQRFEKFRAATLDEAYRQMRLALGEDAVVVRTAHVNEGGVLGLLGRKAVEVTAAVPVSPRSRFKTPCPNLCPPTA